MSITWCAVRHTLRFRRHAWRHTLKEAFALQRLQFHHETSQRRFFLGLPVLPCCGCCCRGACAAAGCFRPAAAAAAVGSALTSQSWNTNFSHPGAASSARCSVLRAPPPPQRHTRPRAVSSTSGSHLTCLGARSDVTGAWGASASAAPLEANPPVPNRPHLASGMPPEKLGKKMSALPLRGRTLRSMSSNRVAPPSGTSLR